MRPWNVVGIEKQFATKSSQRPMIFQADQLALHQKAVIQKINALYSAGGSLFIATMHFHPSQSAGIKWSGILQAARMDSAPA